MWLIGVEPAYCKRSFSGQQAILGETHPIRGLLSSLFTNAFRNGWVMIVSLLRSNK